MMKICLLLALTVVVGAAALQDGAPTGEAAPEPYSYAYQADSHGAAEQRDAQGRVTGYYTLADADGRERRVDYVADENGFRAKVATNEVGTKSESPANVEMVAAEPTPAQYSAQYTAQSYQAAPAPVQTAQYVRQQTFQTAPQTNFARTGYSQQYAYQPAAYGNTGYYSYSGAPSAYGANYNAAYGGYGARYYTAPVGYGYASATPSSQYYRSTTVSGPAATYSTTGSTSGYRYAAQPAAGVTTTSSYRTVPVGGVATYSAGYPVGATGYTYGGPAGVSTTATRSTNYQGSSNYLVLQKRAAEKEEKATSSS